MPTTPNHKITKPFEDDVLDVKRQSLYARLKRLFSTDVIVRNVGGKQLKIKDTDSIMYATDRNSLRDRFNRIRSTAYNAYTRDFALSYQAARMDLFRDYDCIGPDTIIPLPDGSNPTIAELTEKYKNNPQERFWVFSYDYETNSVKLGKAYHPRKKKGTRLGYKVTFDNGQYVIGSLKHPFMMRDGSYKMIYELRVGDSVMPFYQKNYNCKYNKYRKLYNFSKGWQSEHVIIAEQFMRPLNNNEVVHHKNFNGYDNSPDNLQIMTKNEHIFGNPHPKKSNEIRSKTLKKVFKNRNQTGEHNPKYRGDITFSNVKEKALEFYKENSKINLWDFIKHIHCDHSTLQNRLKKKGYNWKSFKNEVELSLNHKIVSIECIGEIEVYDVTVEKYHNFATDSCFVGNTMDMDPILSSALDIYADECLTYNELGKMITVHSNNDNVKRILENLYDEILNVRFNLWSWVRNMCKYGDFYLKLYITPEYGIYMVEPISAYNVERIENSDPFNKRYVKFQVRPADTSQAEILENYEVAHFRLISDSNFLPYGKCLTANNYVETEFGCKRINEIEVGDKVWTFNTNTKIYELSNVLNICNSGVKETLKISTQHNEIECSATHPILVFQNNKSCLEYKQAKDININDLLVITSNKHRKANKMPLNKTLLTEGNHNGWKNNILNLPDYIDLEFARFFGFMIGDGWINQDFNRVSFARGINETTNSKYDSILAKYSGKNVIVLPPGENSGGQSYVDSKLLAEFLYVNGFRGTVTTKRIPHWVYEMSDEFQREFIQGLVDADGSIFTDKWNVNRYSIELNNKELVEDIKSLLGRLNIKCSNVKTRGFEGETEICGIKCNRNKSYYIYFYLDGEEKSQLKKYDFVHSNNIFLYPVTKIENIGEQETFDIQVDSSNSNFISNGIIVHNSMIEGARRVWKQLSLMEDAMLISRIMRAPERRIFYTDIANIPPNEVDAYMQKMMDKLKKVPYIDEKTGEYNLRFNLQNMIEDYYIPVRGGDSGTRIDTLSGMEWTGIDDLEYIKTKMMSALKIPKAFLGFEEGISGKATLASEDVRFARTIQRLQRIIASELSKIAIIHLYAQGYRDESLVDFEIELTNPSTIFEKEKIEIWQDKVSVSIDMIDNKIFPYKWIYRNIFNMSEDDIKQVQEEIVEDAKQRFRFTRIEEDGDDPAKPYKKIKLGGDEEEEGGGGGGESDLGDLLGGGGGLDKPLPDLGDLGKEGGGGGGGGGEAGKAPDLSAIKEITEKKRMELHKERKRDRKRDRRDRYPSGRDQTGEKKSPNISEDPLGALATDETHKEKSEGKSSSAIGHNYAGGSPLSLKERKTRTVDDGMITSLSNFLKKSQSETKKELLEENRLTGSKSLLDESQILE